jgi:ADP-heptose:LPS heptosyltransferase
MRATPFKIGIVRALYLGDLLCIIPAARAIRAAYPDAHISLIGLQWQQSFVERFHHYFDEFVEFKGWPGLPEQSIEPKSIVDFLYRMQEKNFDLVLQMQGNGMITNTMCMLFGASKVAGLRREGEYSPDEKLFPISEDTDHEILRFLKLVDALGIPRQGVDLEFPLLANEVESSNKLASDLNLPLGTYLCVHAGARDPRRRWPPQRFAYACDNLSNRGYTIVLTGSSDEKDILRSVERQMKNVPVNIVERAGHLPLGELAALIKNSAGLLSNDTGVSHIAAALHVPSVVLFSAYSTPERWAPLDRTRHRIMSWEEAANENAVVNAVLATIKPELIKAGTSSLSH